MAAQSQKQVSRQLQDSTTSDIAGACASHTAGYSIKRHHTSQSYVRATICLALGHTLCAIGRATAAVNHNFVRALHHMLIVWVLSGCALRIS